MEILEKDESLALLSKLSGKWIIQLTGIDGWYDESQGRHRWSVSDVLDACPFLNLDDHVQVMLDGMCILIFDHEEEAQSLFSSLPSDDNPPDSNGAKLRFHLLLFSPKDGLVNEST